MPFRYLETARLRLRLLDSELYSMVFKTYNDEALMDFFGFIKPEMLVAERKKFEGGLTTYNRSFLLFQLIDKKTDKVIGSCGFHNWLSVHARAEIGYVLHDVDSRQKGYMSEAVSAIIDYGFTEMKLQRIEALTSPHNEASIKIIEAHKFTKEGLLRKHFCVEGDFSDSVIYGLLKEDYYKP